MGKKRNTTKPQGTFTPEDVTALYRALWDMGEALRVGDMRLARRLHIELFALIPDTTTNDGARTRARNARRKRNQLLATQPTTEQDEDEGDSLMAKRKHQEPLPEDPRDRIVELLAKLAKLKVDGEKLDAAIAAGETIIPTEDGSGFILADGYVTGTGEKPAPMPDTNPEDTGCQLPTKRMRTVVEKFDALPEDEQVDQLRSMWGDE